jgi:hypothetical protein
MITIDNIAYIICCRCVFTYSNMELIICYSMKFVIGTQSCVVGPGLVASSNIVGKDVKGIAQFCKKGGGGGANALVIHFEESQSSWILPQWVVADLGQGYTRTQETERWVAWTITMFTQAFTKPNTTK